MRFGAWLAAIHALVAALAIPARPQTSIPSGLEARGARLVKRMLDGMEAQGDDGVGPQIAAFIHTYGVAVEFREQEPWVTSSNKHIYLKSSLADAPPSFAAVHLADGVIRLINAEYPDTVEKLYMRLSFMARAWLELGGSPSRLPDFGGVEDRRTGALITAWLSARTPSQLAPLAQWPSLADLQQRNRDLKAALRAVIEKGLQIGDPLAVSKLDEESLQLAQAELRFFSFIKQENNWIEWRASR